MATLEELLRDRNPEQLKMLLSSAGHSPAPILPTVEPVEDPMVETPAPRDLQKLMNQYKGVVDENGMGGVPVEEVYKAPATPQGVGPLGDPSKYKPSMNGQSFGFSGSWEEPDLAKRTMASGVNKTSSPGPVQERAPAVAPLEEGFSNNTVANLQAEQDAANKTKELNAALRNLNLFSSGLMGGNKAALKPNNEGFDVSDKMADEKVSQFKERVDKEKDDPNSNYSKEFKAFIEPMLKEIGINPAVIAKASASQIKEMLPWSGKLYEGKQNREMRETIANENRMAREDIRAEKKAEKRKLSDKQVEGINEFDDTVNKAQAALVTLGNKAGWVGPVDGRIPDIVRPADEVAFRSAVGRMSDAYRKLITGAGASNLELSKLEGRLPQATDSLSQFKAKAQNLIKETKKAKETHLSNYQKQGKDASPFQTSSSSGTDTEFDDSTERGIKRVMESNQISREEAIEALREAGRL